MDRRERVKVELGSSPSLNCLARSILVNMMLFDVFPLLDIELTADKRKDIGVRLSTSDIFGKM